MHPPGTTRPGNNGDPLRMLTKILTYSNVNLVYVDGNVCISILHTPGDDPMMYEQASERWSPVQSVEKVILSVISMLAGMYRDCLYSAFASVRKYGFSSSSFFYDFLFATGCMRITSHSRSPLVCLPGDDGCGNVARPPILHSPIATLSLFLFLSPLTISLSGMCALKHFVSVASNNLFENPLYLCVSEYFYLFFIGDLR